MSPLFIVISLSDARLFILCRSGTIFNGSVWCCRWVEGSDASRTYTGQAKAVECLVVVAHNTAGYNNVRTVQTIHGILNNHNVSGSQNLIGSWALVHCFVCY